MLTSSDIFLGLISSTFISYLYGLMRRILHVIFITEHYKIAAPLVNNRDIKNGPVYRVLHLYVVCLWIMNLSPTLLSWSTRFLFSCMLSLLICACFSLTY